MFKSVYLLMLLVTSLVACSPEFRSIGTSSETTTESQASSEPDTGLTVFGAVWSRCYQNGSPSAPMNPSAGNSVRLTMTLDGANSNYLLVSYIGSTDCSTGASVLFDQDLEFAEFSLTSGSLPATFVPSYSYVGGQYRGGVFAFDESTPNVMCFWNGATPAAVDVADLNDMPGDAGTWTTGFSTFLSDPEANGTCLDRI